ncbi:hypothetical protein D7X33_17735 [Butyricicoccus sp. 1XD8-22]|nr:hypothetical protein D7X33_17735 [Butyricicoccus sp. 1XD8-22]
MSLQSKKLTKKQAEIIEELISTFEQIHNDIVEFGEEEQDLQDTKDSIIGLAEDLAITFGCKANKIFQ